MATNKNDNKMHDLSEKIASKEGLKVEEIEKDVSQQMGHAKTPDLTHRLAHQEGVSAKEINKDLNEQMGRPSTSTSTSMSSPEKTKGSNVWLYVIVIAAFALAAWWIFSKYF